MFLLMMKENSQRRGKKIWYFDIFRQLNIFIRFISYLFLTWYHVEWNGKVDELSYFDFV